jgi:hypothetical protein
VSRTSELLALVASARGDGIPVVVWVNHGRAPIPGANEVAAQADLVVGQQPDSSASAKATPAALPGTTACSCR